MSVKVMSAVFDAGGLRPALKSVLLALADHASEDGNSVYPGVNRVVIKSGLSERAVRKALSELRDKNLLIVVKEATQHYPTEYAINLKVLHSLRHPDLREMHPSTISSHAPDAPLEDPDLHDVPARPAPDAPKPSINHQENTRIAKETLDYFFQKTQLDKFNDSQDLNVFLDLMEDYGNDRLRECIDWVSTKTNMTTRKALRSMQTALPNWGRPPRPPERISARKSLEEMGYVIRE